LQDEVDLSLTRWALQHQIPFLAICRGMQLVNVALGGTLIQDLQAASYEDHGAQAIAGRNGQGGQTGHHCRRHRCGRSVRRGFRRGIGLRRGRQSRALHRRGPHRHQCGHHRARAR
ncbi:MAG: hypothetical protein EBZ93_10450, partial [Actinobacteria bacterium]|nr:hypothetical protein [Actinomycetota bacterium]